MRWGGTESELTSILHLYVFILAKNVSKHWLHFPLVICTNDFVVSLLCARQLSDKVFYFLLIYYFLMGSIFDPKKILWFLLRSLQSSREQRTAHELVREQWIQRLLCSETQHRLQKREMWRLEGLTVPVRWTHLDCHSSSAGDLDRVIAYPKTFLSSLIIWEWSLPFAPG